MPKRIWATFLFLCTLALAVIAGEIHLTFHQSSYDGITNYAIWYGRSSYGYTNKIDCGTNGDLIISNLDVGTPWFFNVTSQSTNGLESSFTKEFEASIPTATNAIISVAWSDDLSKPWVPVLQITNDASVTHQFWRTSIIITNQ